MAFFSQGSNRDPDAGLLVLFKHEPLQHDDKSKAEGRPIFEDVEMVEIRAPGSRDVKVFPAMTLSASGWVDGPGGQQQITYAERFSRQYRQFKQNITQTKIGTPLNHAPFMTAARCAEMRALNVYTVEQLAGVEGQELKNLGPGGRDLKNKATEYIAETKAGAPNIQLQAELEAVKARNQILEEDMQSLKSRVELSGDEALDGMSDSQLKDFIANNMGTRPIGNPARKTLLRMAMDARPGKAE